MEAGGGVSKAKLGRRGQNPDLFGGGRIDRTWEWIK